MTMLLFVCALVGLWAVGASMLAALGVRIGGPGGVACDVLVGMITVAAVGTMGVVSGFGARVGVVYLLGLIVYLYARWRGRAPSFRLPPLLGSRLGAGEIVAGVLVLGVLTAHLALAARDRLWWDGWAIWAPKSFALFRYGTLPADLRDPHGPLAYTQVGYPLALPLVQHWFFVHVRAASGAFASVVGVLLFALLPAMVYGATAGAEQKLRLAAGVAVALCSPIAFYAAGGTADVLIALALLGIVSEVLRDPTDPAVATRLGFWLLLAVLSKDEGVPLAAVTAVALAAYALGRPRPWAWLARVAAPLIFALPWLVAVQWMLLGTRVGAGSHVGAAAPVAPDGRALRFVTGLTVIFGQAPLLPLVLAAGLGLWLALHRGDSRGRTAAAIVLGYAAVLMIAYLFVFRSVDVGWLLQTAALRVFGPLLPASLVVAVSTVGCSSAADMSKRNYGVDAPPGA
ncbi:MAG TPA: hypothetical protein VF178_09040 [Gemmatimonadaceae bacterium]